MKTLSLLILTTTLLIPSQHLFGQAGVYVKTADAPRLTKTPTTVGVRNSSGVDAPFRVRVSLAEIRLDSDSSRGSAGMTGRLNVFRKFFRVEISGATRVSQPAKMIVKYQVEENSQTGGVEETVPIDKMGANFIIDTEGFEDKYGTDVRSSSSGSSTTSTKYKHFEAEIVAAHITIYDKAGAELYVGSWPEPVSQPPSLPDHLKPRVYTSTDGKELTATVSSVDEESATLLVNGKPFKVPLSRLSSGDKEFLSQLRRQVSGS